MAIGRCASRLAGSGQISRDEFAHGIEAYGIQAKSREEVNELFSIIDAGGDGSIDLNELKQGLKRLEVCDPHPDSGWISAHAHAPAQPGFLMIRPDGTPSLPTTHDMFKLDATQPKC